MKKNVLVFPCGSEIGLEIYRSLSKSIHFNIIGASSIDDHGKFIFQNYIGDAPFVEDANFICDFFISFGKSPTIFQPINLSNNLPTIFINNKLS